jgi:acetolactate synthase-1/2/3 large subunit
MSHTTAQVIAHKLYDAGVRYVFGHPGGEVVDLIEALEQTGIQFVLMGHESAAALAAGTMGCASGIPGVCLSTLGPGACNLVLGVGEALLDRQPLLAISARTALGQEDWFSHQDLALNEMFAPITKASIALDGTGTAAALQQAIDLTLTPPQGPVYLSLPGDVAAAPDKPGDLVPSAAPASAADAETLEKILAALNRAQHPVAVIGLALNQRHDGPAVRRFLTQTGIPYVDTPKTKGLVDPTSEAFLGTCLSGSGDALLAEFLRQSDCLLGIGFDPVESAYDWHLADNYYGVTNASTVFKSYRPHVEASGDVGQMITYLAERYSGQPAWDPGDWATLQQNVQNVITPAVEAGEQGLAPYYVARALRQFLPAETRLAVDTGQHKMLFVQAWRTGEPLSYFGSNGLSSMGPGVPGAIALALLDPNRPVVGISGDGGFGMMVQELETINRLGLSPLLVVLCDRALSLIRIPQQMRGYPSRGIDLAPVDWAQVAAGFGVRGIWARTLGELQKAVSDWRDNPQATVLAVQIDEKLYCGNSY